MRMVNYNLIFQAEIVECRDDKYSLCKDGVEVIRNVVPLKNWLEAYDENLELDWNEEHKQQIASILNTLIEDRDPVRLKEKRYGWKLCSTIFRRATSNIPRYTNMVHRDLDEWSVDNLKREGHVHFYNAWIPRSAILSNPLALLDQTTTGKHNRIL